MDVNQLPLSFFPSLPPSMYALVYGCVFVFQINTQDMLLNKVNMVVHGDEATLHLLPRPFTFPEECHRMGVRRLLTGK